MITLNRLRKPRRGENPQPGEAPGPRPTFAPRPAADPFAKTRPQRVLDERPVMLPAPVAEAPPVDRRQPGATLSRPAPRHEAPAMSVMRRVAGALRGRTPIWDAARAEHVPAGRNPDISARRVAAAQRRLSRIAYPEPGCTYGEDFFAAIDRATRTTGPRAATAGDQDGTR